MKSASRIGFGLVAFVLALALTRCTDDDPPMGGPAPTIPAPVHVSPPSGTIVANQPTLTVSNVTPSDGSTPTYHFQVSLNSTYSPVAAEQTAREKRPPEPPYGVLRGVFGRRRSSRIDQTQKESDRSVVITNIGSLSRWVPSAAILAMCETARSAKTTAVAMR